MDPFFGLILLCIAMLVASFLAGNIPLSFHLSEERLKLISNFGVGLLVGTSLVVIIPEGVETLYSVPKPVTAPSNLAGTGAAGGGFGHNKPIKRSDEFHPDTTATGFAFIPGVRRTAAMAMESDILKRKNEEVVIMSADHGYALMQGQLKRHGNVQASSFEDNMLKTRQDDSGNSPLDPTQATENHAPVVSRRQDDGDDGKTGAAAPPDDQKDNDTDNNHPDQQQQQQQQQPDQDDDRDSISHDDADHDEEEEDDVHKYIGLALLAGFILMFLIDQMGPTHAHGHNNHVSVADFTELHNLQLDDGNIRMPSAVGMNVGGKKRGNPITIGLVVHAAADGIALGASASRPELRLIVFLAIMLHKAPAAFGLSTVLLQHGFSRRQTRQQVAIFSLAAPVGAILTYIFIQLSGHREEASLHWWTGMLLLFSGGTFLYVAMHVMSEMNNTERSSSGYSVGSSGEKGLSVVEVLCVIGGMIVPLILSVDHEH
ncbi:hypothetical protein BGX28_000411 [Mortierella sp. GBA30]|nr:hypothetical protein BGX28_000411 [Mortierella sp. GBA30]